jgi:hypothetical protein
MNRPTATWALVFAIAAAVGATPTLGDGSLGRYAGAAATGAAAAQSRPAPSHGPNIITRPAPPLHRAPAHADGHHRPGSVFIQPPFFGTRPFGYPYNPYSLYAPYFPYTPYSPYTPRNPLIPSQPYSFYAFGQRPAPSMITDPYYCWIDGIGFSSEERFARHLHEVHGVPLDKALASSELVDGHYVFFGY